MSIDDHAAPDHQTVSVNILKLIFLTLFKYVQDLNNTSAVEAACYVIFATMTTYGTLSKHVSSCT